MGPLTALASSVVSPRRTIHLVASLSVCSFWRLGLCMSTQYSIPRTPKVPKAPPPPGRSLRPATSPRNSASRLASLTLLARQGTLTRAGRADLTCSCPQPCSVPLSFHPLTVPVPVPPADEDVVVRHVTSWQRHIPHPLCAPHSSRLPSPALSSFTSHDPRTHARHGGMPPPPHPPGVHHAVIYPVSLRARIGWFPLICFYSTLPTRLGNHLLQAFLPHIYRAVSSSRSHSYPSTLPSFPKLHLQLHCLTCRHHHKHPASCTSFAAYSCAVVSNPL